MALAFHYGRYLLVSSSRRGSLPANLQGVWADGLKAPWSGDYHLNINLEMTYWAAFSANLVDAAAPLSRFVTDLAVSGATVAKDWRARPRARHAGARRTPRRRPSPRYGVDAGWVAHGYTDVWRDARALGENKWALCVTCGAWAALALADAADHAPSPPPGLPGE